MPSINYGFVEFYSFMYAHLFQCFSPQVLLSTVRSVQEYLLKGATLLETFATTIDPFSIGERLPGEDFSRVEDNHLQGNWGRQTLAEWII